MLVIDSC